MRLKSRGSVKSPATPVAGLGISSSSDGDASISSLMALRTNLVKRRLVVDKCGGWCWVVVVWFRERKRHLQKKTHTHTHHSSHALPLQSPQSSQSPPTIPYPLLSADHSSSSSPFNSIIVILLLSITLPCFFCFRFMLSAAFKNVSSVLNSGS